MDVDVELPKARQYSADLLLAGILKLKDALLTGSTTLP
jgi:hypothetical protein